MKEIPHSEFKFNFSRSSGAGGQNVNKVNTKVTLTWNIKDSKSLLEGIKERFFGRYKRFVIDGQVVIKSQRYRSQSRNIEDCIAKLDELLGSVEFAPKRRRSTKPTRGSIKKRLENKKMHSSKKRNRSEKF